jgi:single-strand DNA-binding protein
MAKYRDINKAVITGNLTNDPIDSYTSAGTCVIRMNVAVNRGIRDGKDQGADFIPVTAWGRIAESCLEWLRKGSKVAVEGSIKVGMYKKDGQQHYKTEIVAQQILFLSTPSKQDEDDNKYPTQHMKEKANGYQPEHDDDFGDADIPL